MKPSLDQLRALPGLMTAPPLWESFPFRGLARGIPRGALTELSGPWGGGKTETVMQFLTQNPLQKTVWIEKTLTVFPTAFADHGVRLEQILWIETQGANLPGSDWVIQQILKTKLFPVVIWLEPPMDEATLRRTQLAAQKAAAAVILLREFPVTSRAWPLALRLYVSRSQTSGEPVIEVLKARAALEQQTF